MPGSEPSFQTLLQLFLSSPRTVTCAGSKAEAEQLVADFLGDDAKVRALMGTYLASRPFTTAPSGSGHSSGTAAGGAGPDAGHEVSGPGAVGVKGSGLSSTGGRTLVDMRARQVRGATRYGSARLFERRQ